MKNHTLRYHTNSSSFYDKQNKLYPEPKYSITELEEKLNEAIEKLKDLNSKYSTNTLDINLSIAKHNLCSYIENLEWNIDLKSLHMENLTISQ